MPGEHTRASRVSCSARGSRLLLAVLEIQKDLIDLYRQYCWLAIVFTNIQESPDHPYHLMDDGHTGLIPPKPRHQLPHPNTLGIGFIPDMADNRARAMNQQPS